MIADRVPTLEASAIIDFLDWGQPMKYGDDSSLPLVDHAEVIEHGTVIIYFKDT